MKERTIGTYVVLSPHELFWLEVIRVASNDTDPVPTLKRTQELRLLFSEAAAPAARQEAHLDR